MENKIEKKSGAPARFLFVWISNRCLRTFWRMGLYVYGNAQKSGHLILRFSNLSNEVETSIKKPAALILFVYVKIVVKKQNKKKQ